MTDVGSAAFDMGKQIASECYSHVCFGGTSFMTGSVV